MKGLKKNLIETPTDERQPVTLDILRTLCQNAYHLSANAFKLQLLQAVFTTAFVVLLRKSEYTSLSQSRKYCIALKDVIITENKITLKIRDAKTAGPGEIQVATLERQPDFEFCPFEMLMQYLKMRPTKTGALFTYLHGAPITESYLVMRLHQILQFSGFPLDFYKSHSFQISGVTFYASRGLEGIEIQEKGQWTTDTFLTYICPPKEPQDFPQLSTKVSSYKHHIRCNAEVRAIISKAEAERKKATLTMVKKNTLTEIPENTTNQAQNTKKPLPHKMIVRQFIKEAQEAKKLTTTKTPNETAQEKGTEPLAESVPEEITTVKAKKSRKRKAAKKATKDGKLYQQNQNNEINTTTIVSTDVNQLEKEAEQQIRNVLKSIMQKDAEQAKINEENERAFQEELRKVEQATAEWNKPLEPKPIGYAHPIIYVSSEVINTNLNPTPAEKVLFQQHSRNSLQPTMSRFDQKV